LACYLQNTTQNQSVMKNHKLIQLFAVILLMFSNLTLFAFSEHPPVFAEVPGVNDIVDSLDVQQSIDKSVQNAIASGNSTALAVHFFTSIELSIPDAQGSYSKAQAELLMKNFFSKYPPKSFTIINEGQSGGEKSRFAIGTYTTTKGDDFRVYYLIKEISGKNQLTILKFE